jgi:gluconolactonase
VSQASPVTSLSPPAARSPFVSHDPEFGAVLGGAPRLAHVVATDAHEGPVYLPGEDALLFTSAPRGGPPSSAHPVVAVRRLALDGRRFPLGAERISTLREDANVANGMTLDREGRLIASEQGTFSTNAAISRDGRVLASSWNGKPLNSPNDVVVKSDGTIWFTDPSYGRLQGFRPEPLLGDHVYRYDPDDGSMRVAARGFDKPNGLCFAPDESVLYVADNGTPHHLKAFDVDAGGQLADERVIALFGEAHPDGLKTDAAGRIYASFGGGVRVLAPDGRALGDILIPGAVNFCFGGAERDVLFVTADHAIWAAELAATGPALPPALGSAERPRTPTHTRGS